MQDYGVTAGITITVTNVSRAAPAVTQICVTVEVSLYNWFNSVGCAAEPARPALYCTTVDLPTTVEAASDENAELDLTPKRCKRSTVPFVDVTADRCGLAEAPGPPLPPFSAQRGTSECVVVVCVARACGKAGLNPCVFCAANCPQVHQGSAQPCPISPGKRSRKDTPGPTRVFCAVLA